MPLFIGYRNYGNPGPVCAARVSRLVELVLGTGNLGNRECDRERAPQLERARFAKPRSGEMGSDEWMTWTTTSACVIARLAKQVGVRPGIRSTTPCTVTVMAGWRGLVPQR
jgi:hypothetical protein